MFSAVIFPSMLSVKMRWSQLLRYAIILIAQDQLSLVDAQADLCRLVSHA